MDSKNIRFFSTINLRRSCKIFCFSLIYSFLTTSTFAITTGSDTQTLISPVSSSIIIEKDTNQTNDLPVATYAYEEPCQVANTFTPEVLRWNEEICRWSEEHKLDPNLIATVMQIESCGNHLAVSATGVRGLFQVTGANLDGEDPFDPNVSMAKGPGKVLKNEINAAKGDIVAAMAGYNGGGFARDYISGKLTRSQFYWKLRNHASGYWRSDGKARAKINEVEHYARWANIFTEAKDNHSQTLNQWLEAGGARLCTQASTIATHPLSTS